MTNVVTNRWFLASLAVVAVVAGVVVFNGGETTEEASTQAATENADVQTTSTSTDATGETSEENEASTKITTENTSSQDNNSENTTSE